MVKIEEDLLWQFKKHLISEEKSRATIEKYIHDIQVFFMYMKEETVTKEAVISYKEYLQEHYQARSVNSMLASLNKFFLWREQPEFRVRQLKIQQQAFCPEEMELTRQEYIRLVKAARKMENGRLEMILQTICATGIRIGELRFITAKAVRAGFADVDCKGKSRRVMIASDLRKKLLLYMSRLGIKKGIIFITAGGKGIDRSNVWREMKHLSREANVSKAKIFPHNLRHLFARSFYKIERDIVKLADVLGHSNINTTRIYMISTGKEHQKQLDAMRLII